jgi:hypothetical protein
MDDTIKICLGTFSTAQGPGVKFHEIKIHFFMRLNFFVIFHEVEIPNNDLIS